MIHNNKAFLIFVCQVTFAQYNLQIPKSYIAYKTTEKITIDGFHNEAIWNRVPWSSSFVDIEGSDIPIYDTRVKMIWDDIYFYILGTLEAPHIWGDIQKKDAIIYHNNDFEVFIDPDNNGHTYYEIEINALNTIWDLFLTKPYRESSQSALNDWDANGLKSAIQIDGSLNNSEDIDRKWLVEMAIPWKVFKTAYFQNNIPSDSFWRINFSRVNWEHEVINGKYQRKKDKKGRFLPEKNWVWSPHGEVNMHQPEKWGYVFFSTKKIIDTVSFEIPNDEKIKWMLFEVYRKQKQYFAKHKEWSTSLKKIKAEKVLVLGEEIYPKLDSHDLGYNVIVKSPFTGNLIIIKEDGELVVKQN